MESLFTRSPHSITPFTRSQLTSFPTTGYSIPFSPCFFFFFFCPHKRTFWLHSSTFLTFPCPPTAPLQTHINVHSDHAGTLRTHGHIDTGTHTPIYSKLSRVWHITTKAHISKSQSPFLFHLWIICNNRNRLKSPAGEGGVYCSNQPSLPVQSQHGTRQPSALKMWGVSEGSQELKHLLIYGCACVCVSVCRITSMICVSLTQLTFLSKCKSVKLFTTL